MATTKHIALEVEGMTCASCARNVTLAVESCGATQVDVNMTTGEARFQLPDSTELDTVVRKLKSSGYASRTVGQPSELPRWSPVEKKFAFTLLFTIPLFLHMFFPHDSWINNPWLQLCLSLPVLAVGIQHFGRSAFYSLRSGVPNMDVLIFTGSTAAFGYSLAGSLLYAGTDLAHNYLFFETSATIITLVLLGNVLEHRSVRQTTTAIRALSDLQPELARKVVRNGLNEEIVAVPVSELAVGDLVLVNQGDQIPTDGRIKYGNGLLDESMLTGESEPAEKAKGQQVTGGTILLEGSLTVAVEAVGSGTTLSQIIELVKNAQQQKPEIQRLGDRVSAVFVPIVLGISTLTFVVSYWLVSIPLQEALMNAIAVLVISCPCAMGLATPTAVMAGIGRAAKRGILIKGGSTLELLAKVKTMVFDKTGTLTSGRFEVTQFHNLNGLPDGEIQGILSQLEQHSSHPIARSLHEAYKNQPVETHLQNFAEKSGVGIQASDASSNTYLAGSYRGVADLTSDQSHQVYLRKNDELLAALDLQDELNPGARELMDALHSSTVDTVLLSGDRKAKCREVADEVGINQVIAEQLPHEKLAEIDRMSSQHATAMVGDGINDAPALSAATVGISLGGASQVAIDSAQVILLSGHNLLRIHEALQISRHTVLTIKQNLFWALFYNVLAIPIAAMGYLNPMMAALAMALSDVVVIGNSIRLKSKRIDR